MARSRDVTVDTVLIVFAAIVGIGTLLFALSFVKDYIARKRQEQAEATGEDVGEGIVQGLFKGLGDVIFGERET